MAVTKDDLDAIAHAVWAYNQKGLKKQAWAYIQAAANPAAFAAAIVKALPAGTGGALTEADVEAAVRKVFADAAS